MGKDYDAARNSAGSYDVGIKAIRLAGVKAGRFLPLADALDEIAASPVVDDVRRVALPGGQYATLYRGDCTRIVPLLAGDRPWIDACVTDPPYELGFMGKAWDATGVAAAWQTWGAVRIALKPGGHLCAFAGSRTYDRIAGAIRDAGLEIRDQLMWLYGSGFPKSHDVAKAVDKSGGVWRGRAGAALPGDPKEVMLRGYRRSPKGEAVFDDAKRWEGWGTALKPAHEPIALARKPLSEATVAANVLRWATGALNIDGARVSYTNQADHAAAAAAAAAARVTRDVPGRERWDGAKGTFLDPAGSLAGWQEKSEQGRWPANVMTDGSVEVFDAFPPNSRDALRFFYSPKAGRDERDEGMTVIEKSRGTVRQDGGAQHTKGVEMRANHHPTVKPVDLMRWLCRLVTPPAGIVLDPFMGSGSTGIAALREGFSFVGIEQDASYFDIAAARITAAAQTLEREPDLVRAITRSVGRIKAEQGDLF